MQIIPSWRQCAPFGYPLKMGLELVAGNPTEPVEENFGLPGQPFNKGLGDILTGKGISSLTQPTAFS